MLVVLSFCHLDRDQAKKSLEWIEELGGGVNHELMLAWSMQVGRVGPPQDLIDIAKRAFKTVFEFPLFDEDERGHPMSANHAWLSCAHRIANPHPKVLPAPQPWLWIEPDAVLLTKTGFDQIEAEYKLRDRPFMGDIVPENAERKVRRRPSGVGVYPWSPMHFAPEKVLMLDRQAWDDFFAEEFLPEHFQTPLIQDMYCMSRDPDIEPTFHNHADLQIVAKDAVLFHRCSDGTLIDRLREQKSGGCLAKPPQAESMILWKDEAPEPKAEVAKRTCGSDFDFHEVISTACVRQAGVLDTERAHHLKTTQLAIQFLSTQAAKAPLSKARIVKQLTAVGLVPRVAKK